MTSATAGVTPRTHRPTTTPHTSRTPYSVGQSHPNPRFSPQSVSHGPRSPSPNYFGLTIDPSKPDPLSSGGGQHVRKNWSPPTSNVRSTAAVSPRIIPLDQNPEFEAFRRASEANGFNALRMSGFNMSAPSNPRRSSKSGSISHSGPLSPSQIMLPPSPRTTVPGYETKFAETKQRSPKRLLSSPAPHVTDRPRRNSPAGFNERDAALAPQVARFLDQEGWDSRHSMPPVESAPPPPTSLHQRADTLPSSLDSQNSGDSSDSGPQLVSSQFVYGLMEDEADDTLILDVRVSTQYAKSRIQGALNLCIPTTLLKRPAYNTKKLSETFTVEEQRLKFDSWRRCRSIVIYDANSTKMKDAGPCLKMLEKFENEGWNGASYIIRGGFLDFSRKFPASVSHGFDAGTSGTVAAGGSLAPVIGGCPMPHTENAANPFFNNIRQNQDLIGGVGQMALQRPSEMSKAQKENLPQWLKRAISYSNEGKMVSDKFLNIEQKEQQRMQQAMSQKVSYGTPAGDEERVQLAGIEKGAKNRYNNIWPYEHSRVKLEGPLINGCDYINANYVQSQWSNKRYIATQGPIPATFADFWNVVWQQDVRVIVMLTAETENGQLKAHNYWAGKRYGSITVHLHSEHRASLEPSKIREHRDQRANRPAGPRRSTTSNRSPTRRDSDRSESSSSSSDAPYVIVRNLTISNSEEPFARMREITQLHYTSWPDFGAPAHPTHLLGLVEQCNAVVRASSGGRELLEPVPADERPVLVHCSAGCGRTGTFCTVDSVLDMLKRQMQYGYLRNRGHDHSRNARQPTPMDVDSRSRQSSLNTLPSPVKTRDVGSFFAHIPTGSGAKGGDWVQRDDIDLIEKVVSDFRLQRLSMVQSLRQYVLCYESVLEWLVEEGALPS